MFYLHILSPIYRMHFCIYSLSSAVIFMLWGVDQVISVCDLAKKICNSAWYVAVKKWKSSLAILNRSFKVLQILTVQIQ